MADDTVWPMAPDDLDWLVELSAQRRARLAPAAPLMWRPAADSRERHRPFLAALLDDESSVLAIRNRRGFLVALERGDHWLVDDADVTPDGDWETDGVELLEYAEQMCGPLRLVVPVVETERMAAARAVGLFPVVHWWHRDLERARPAGGVPGAEEVELTVAGVAGRLVAAPPVYDPGGPVLMVTEVYGAAALRSAEAAAASRGATVSVVTQRPEQQDLASLLDAAGYILTTAFCGASA